MFLVVIATAKYMALLELLIKCGLGSVLWCLHAFICMGGYSREVDYINTHCHYSLYMLVCYIRQELNLYFLGMDIVKSYEEVLIISYLFYNRYTTDINLFVNTADFVGMDSKRCHLVGVFVDSAPIWVIADTCLCSRQALAIFVPSFVCFGYITHLFI